MEASFDALGQKVQNVLRALGDNHAKVMREFLKVEAILIENTIVLKDMRDMINSVMTDLETNTNLQFHGDKLAAIEKARQWFILWSEEDPDDRLDNFSEDSIKGSFWCDNLVGDLGHALLPGYIAEWVDSSPFKELVKPSPCTPETYATAYTLRRNSFDALFEFVAMFKLYINQYSSATVQTLNRVRVDMAKTFKDTLKEINEMTSC
jgi:hypothetical protein